MYHNGCSCGSSYGCDSGLQDICKGVHCITSGIGKGICDGVGLLQSLGCVLLAPLQTGCCCGHGNGGFSPCCGHPHPPHHGHRPRPHVHGPDCRCR